MPKSLPLYFLAGPSILLPFEMTYRYTETIVSDDSGMKLFAVEPTPIDAAMRAAVADFSD